MKKTNLICLIIFASLLVGACYQKGATDNSKPKITADKSSTPVAEKTGEKEIQPSKGDYNKALEFYNAKSYDKAVSEFEEVVKTDAKNQQAHFYLGKSHQALKKPDAAISAYKKAIEIKPDFAEANYELGSIYMNRKDYDASLPYLVKAAKINYTSPEYLVTLGDNYRELKRCNYAVVPYGNATNFDKKNTAALYGMGLCYIELKNRIAASQQVRNLEQIDEALAKKLENQIPK